jgi:DNA-binding NarL/FixJ family response regulator
VLDPEVVDQLLARGRRNESLTSLTPCEREVLALVAEGRTNQAVAKALFITGGAVEKHVKSIFGKLGLAQSEADHRRVLAVLAYLHD